MLLAYVRPEPRLQDHTATVVKLTHLEMINHDMFDLSMSKSDEEESEMERMW